MPLLEGLDGVEKMSKSLGNYVGITEPPQEIFGKLMSISDELMWRYIELLSFEPSRRSRSGRGGGRSAQPARRQVRASRRRSSRASTARPRPSRPRRISTRASASGEMPEDMPEVKFSGAPKAASRIAQLLKQAGLTPSTSEALRMIEQGGVRSTART